jgi:tRNA(Arg) A34 adenosine deaminase TadA
MERAIELSILNVKTHNGGPFGAVVVKDGKIISEGVNVVVQNCDPTSHAEIVAIREACKILHTHDLSDCEIYTSCYPCSMCYSCIRWARIDKIYYSNTREDAHDIGFSDKDIYDEIQNKNLKLVQLYNERSKEAFRLWTTDPSNIKY